MKIIFLGCGYLGHNLSTYLSADHDVEVWGLQSPYSARTPWFREVDVFDLALMTLQDLKDAIVVDTVSLVGVNTKVDDEHAALDKLRARYQGLFELLKAKQIRRYIYLSSGGTIYGDSTKPINEEHSLNPKSYYARSKEVLEWVLKNSGLEYVILRPTNPYGGYQVNDNGQGVIPILINKAFKGEVFEMWVDGNSSRDYIYIDDFGKALKLIIDKKVRNTTLNIASNEGTTLNRVIELIEQGTGRPIQIQRVENPVATVKSIVLDITRLKLMTGYEPEVSFEEGMRREINRIREELF